MVFLGSSVIRECVRDWCSFDFFLQKESLTKTLFRNRKSTYLEQVDFGQENNHRCVNKDFGVDNGREELQSVNQEVASNSVVLEVGCGLKCQYKDKFRQAQTSCPDNLPQRRR